MSGEPAVTVSGGFSARVSIDLPPNVDVYTERPLLPNEAGNLEYGSVMVIWVTGGELPVTEGEARQAVIDAAGDIRGKLLRVLAAEPETGAAS